MSPIPRPPHRLRAPLLLLGLWPVLGVPGGAPPGPDGPPDPRALSRGIVGLRRLPVHGIQMVQAGDHLLFLSDTGRYAFLGPAFDLWHGARLTSLAQAETLMGRLDPQRLGLEAGDLGALDLGTGPAEVRVFVDPQCPPAPPCSTACAPCRRPPRGPTGSGSSPCRCGGRPPSGR